MTDDRLVAELSGRPDMNYEKEPEPEPIIEDRPRRIRFAG